MLCFDKIKYFFLLIALALNSKLYANDWDVDISQCTKVIKRFFVNGIENNINSPVDYYDSNNNLILHTFLNERGEERYRALYKYDDNNQLTEYENWSRTPGLSQWNRWGHGIIERVNENGLIVSIKREKRYSGDYEIIRKCIKDQNGNLISLEAGSVESGSYQYYEYNEYDDIILYKYEHEKSDGMHLEIYEIAYNDAKQINSKKTYKDNNLILETNYYYENNLLSLEIINDYRTDTISKREYSYNDIGKITKERRIDENDNEIFLLYYEYDNKNRLIKKGEKRNTHERFSVYEYY